MSETVDGLLIKLGLDSTELSAELAKASAGLQRFSSSAVGGVNKMGDAFIQNTATITKWGAALAAAAAVGLGAVVVRSASAASALNRMAAQVGIATDTFRAMTDSAEDFGIESEKLTKSFLMLESRLVDAAAGAETIAAEFDAAGLSLEQFASQGNEERLYAIANAVAEAGSATERAQIAQAAFGAQGIKMVEWLRQGEAAIRDNVNEFNALHGAMGRLEFAKLHEANKAMGDLGDFVETAGMAVSSALAPALLMVIDYIKSVVAESGGWPGIMDKVTEASRTAIKVVADLWQGMGILWSGAKIGILSLSQSIYGFMNTVAIAWNFWRDKADAVFKFLDAGARTFTATFELMVTTVQVIWSQVVARLAAEWGMMLSQIAAMAKSSGIPAMEAWGESASRVAKQISADAGESSKASRDEWTAAMKANVAATNDWSKALENVFKVPEKEGSKFAESQLAKLKQLRSEADQEFANRTNVDDGTAGDKAAAEFDAYKANLDAKLIAKQEAADAELEIERNTEAMRLGLAQQGAMGRVENDIATAESRLTASRMFSDEDRAIEESNRQLWEASWRGKMDVMGSFLGQMSALMQGENRKMFEIGKAAAIGETMINTYKSATSAYASMAGIPIVGPALGAAAAGAAVVAGLANVNRIRSTSFGGSGSAGGYNYGAGPSATTNASPNVGTPQQQANRQTDVNVTLVGDRFSSSQVRGLISQINDATDDNVTLRTN